MASIQHRQRADGTVAHRVMFRERPGGGVVSETFDTPEQAAFFKALVERIGGAAARAKRDRAHHSTAPTIPAVLEDYIGQAPDLTPGTADEYRRTLTRSGITRELGDLPVDHVSREDVEAWVRDRSRTISAKTGRQVAPKTVANEHGLLSTVLAHAVTRGWIAANPARGVRLPKVDREELQILTDREFLALHAAMTVRYQPLVWLLAATGLRWGEATALQWRDITGTTITVARSWKHDERHGRVLGPPKTARSRRRVETTESVIESLGARGEGFVFTNARGGPVLYHTFHSSHWLPACRRVGLETRIHGLRHFAASYMLAQGTDIWQVSRALGHSDISTTTGLYGHLVPSVTRPTVVHAARLEGLRAGMIDP